MTQVTVAHDTELTPTGCHFGTKQKRKQRHQILKFTVGFWHKVKKKKN